MLGTGWWATGIIVKYDYSGGGKYGWRGLVTYLDDGFCDGATAGGVISTEGTLRTRYAVRGDPRDALTSVVDALIADAGRLGITWKDPTVYYEGDGEGQGAEDAPDGWRAMLSEQATRVGWRAAYAGTRQ